MTSITDRRINFLRNQGVPLSKARRMVHQRQPDAMIRLDGATRDVASASRVPEFPRDVSGDPFAIPANRIDEAAGHHIAVTRLGACVISGAAGVGKTVYAYELARQAIIIEPSRPVMVWTDAQSTEWHSLPADIVWFPTDPALAHAVLADAVLADAVLAADEYERLLLIIDRRGANPPSLPDKAVERMAERAATTEGVDLILIQHDPLVATQQGWRAKAERWWPQEGQRHLITMPLDHPWSKRVVVTGSFDGQFPRPELDGTSVYPCRRDAKRRRPTSRVIDGPAR